MPDSKTVEKPQTLKIRFARFIAILTVIAAALLLGYYVGDWLKGKHFQGPSVTLGIAFLLGTMKDAIPQIQKLWEYIAKGTSEHLFGVSAFVFLLATSIVAASVLPDGTTQQSQLPLIIFLQGSSASSTVPDPSTTNSNSSSDLKISIPFFREANSCKAESDFGDGLLLDASTQTFIQQLANGFLHCAEERKPVTITIQGFASSKPFDKNECGDDSAELNRRLANKRAAVVAESFTQATQALKDKFPALAKWSISFKPFVWNSPQEMEKARAFNDRGPTGLPDAGRGDLTRRVDLVIDNPGGCRLVTARQ